MPRFSFGRSTHASTSAGGNAIDSGARPFAENVVTIAPAEVGVDAPGFVHGNTNVRISQLHASGAPSCCPSVHASRIGCTRNIPPLSIDVGVTRKSAENTVAF